MEKNSFQNFKVAVNEIIGRDSEMEKESVGQAVPEAPQTAAIGKKTAASSAKSIITADAEVTGDIRTSSDLFVEGTVTGNIITDGCLIVSGKVSGSIKAWHCDLKCSAIEGAAIEVEDQIVINSGCTVKAKLTAKRIEAEGAVEGNIWAEEFIHLYPSAKVRGNITAGQIVIDKGAMLDGYISIAKKA